MGWLLHFMPGIVIKTHMLDRDASVQEGGDTWQDHDTSWTKSLDCGRGHRSL